MLKISSKYSAFFTIPLLWIMGYLFFSYVTIPKYFGLFDNLNLFIHEMGHFFFMNFRNEFLSMAGGTIMQVLVPSLILIYFFRQLDFFWVALCFWWIGSNFFYIATYSGDAIKQELPLLNVTGGWIVRHDWYYIFSNLGVLQYTNKISSWFWFLGLLFFVLCFSFWIILVINRWRGV